MKRYLSAAIAGAFLTATAGIALAETVVIAPEQQTVIKEYVHKNPIASINLPGVELNIGSKVPDTVELHTVDVPDVKYKYVVVDNQTVLVDPSTREIVEVIK